MKHLLHNTISIRNYTHEKIKIFTFYFSPALDYNLDVNCKNSLQVVQKTLQSYKKN